MRLFKYFVLVILIMTGILYTKQSLGSDNSREISIMDFQQFAPWLDKETDSVYVVNFWATWCAPCIREIPYFEQLHKAYASQKVKVLLVSLDDPNRVENHVIPFLKRLDVNSQVVLLDDPYANKWIPKVSEEWSGAIPATVIYNKNQKLFFEREFQYKELEEIILPLINKH